MQRLRAIGNLAVIVLHLLCMDLVPYLNAVEGQYAVVGSGPRYNIQCSVLQTMEIFHQSLMEIWDLERFSCFIKTEV